MKKSVDSEPGRDGRRVFSRYPFVIIFASLIAMLSTFLLANSSIDLTTKTRGFSGIIAGFLIVCVCNHLWQTRHSSEAIVEDVVSEADVERGLFVLEEANEFFSGSLKASDTFRLVASRIRELIRYRTIVMYLLDETRSHLVVTETEGLGADAQTGLTIALDDGLVGKCYSNGSVEMGDDNSAAIPLRNGFEVYGVLHICLDPDKAAVA